jgi:serine phosphatase RsbU (regulator of sigma subunit)
LEEGNFITMVLAVLDPVSHTLDFANAGHAPALHYRTREDRFEPLESTGLPLGVLDEPDYPPPGPRTVAVGDIIVLCTDGIVEAMNENGDPFGDQRLEAVVRQHATAPLVQLATELGAAVERFYAVENPADDLTILVARRNA